MAERVRRELQGQRGLVEKRMFGGVAFLVNGNMSVGIHNDELVVRLGPEETDAALKKPGTRIFDLTGRPMNGWILVSGPLLRNSKVLARWVHRGIAYASSLPKKPK